MGDSISVPVKHGTPIKKDTPIVKGRAPNEFQFVVTLTGLEEEQTKILHLSDLKEVTFDALANVIKDSTFSFLSEKPDPKLTFEVILSFIHELGLEIRIMNTRDLVRAVEECRTSGLKVLRMFAGIELASECRGKLKCFTTPEEQANGSNNAGYMPPATTNAAGIPAAPVLAHNYASRGLVTPVKLETEMDLKRKPNTDSSSAAATKKIKTEPMPDRVSSTKAKAPKKAKRATGGDGSVAEKILKSLMELRTLNIPDPSKGFVALMSGYTNPASAGFVKQLSQLKKDGMVDLPAKGKVALTPKALTILPPVEAPKTNAEVQYRLRSTLKTKTSQHKTTKSDEVFEILKDGITLPKRQLGLLMNYTNPASAGFVKVLSQLSGTKLVEYPDKSSVRLSNLCFPYGRPTHVPAATNTPILPAPPVKAPTAV